MELTWPLVGRTEELRHVTDLIRGGRRAIVLAGPAGVGKTRLATECLAVAAAAGFVPLRVAATQGAASLPFGAFASLIPHVDPGSDRRQMLRRIAQAIAGRGEGRAVAVFVDDAHLLDDASAALTHLLAGTAGTCLLATLRSGEPACDPVVALWKDGLAERIDLGPLTPAHVAELLAGGLGGPVDGAAAHLLYERTRGNALALRELVLGALEAGVLRSEEGVWRLRGVLPTSPRLVEIIESRLRDVGEPVRRGLDVLALAEPLEVALVLTAEPSIDLEDLERRGLARIERTDRRLSARLAHPLYGEALRARLSPLRARASARALADALGSTGARRREDTLRLATWRLDGGGAYEAAVMLAAATTARQRDDFPLAERLARAALEAGAVFDAGLLLGQLCWLQGRPREAERQLGALARQAATDTERGLLAAERMNNLFYGLQDPAGALRIAEEADGAITDAGCRDQIAIERARILGRSGNYGDAVALLGPLLGRASGRALVNACQAAGTFMMVTGQLSGLLDATERGLAEHRRLDGPPLPFGAYLHLVIRCGGLAHAGRLAEADAVGWPEYRRAIGEGAVEAHAFFAEVLARSALIQGRVATASHLAGESAGAFRELGWPLWIRNALAFRAHALALLGRVQDARHALRELDALGVAPAHLHGAETLLARAWTEVAGGDIPAGRGYAQEAADMARRGGAYALESLALHDLARLGRAPVAAGRLRELTEVVQGPLAPLRADHAAALVAGDAAGLEASSGAFEAIGAILLAAEAAADAAVALRRAGEPRRAAAAERRSGDLAARCEGAGTPALSTAAPARAALTVRELEIARLAASGLANKEIAARLYLSHRTVENKLYAAYEKLGVTGRAELARALEGS
jgi:DNA-binding CsgD family transcriptional regulator/type II secretory pathway predicted ATPase ExeA